MARLKFKIGGTALSVYLNANSSERNCGYYEAGVTSFDGNWQGLSVITSNRALRFIADMMIKNVWPDNRALILSASTEGDQELFLKLLTKTKRFKVVGTPTGNHCYLGEDDEDLYQTVMAVCFPYDENNGKHSTKEEVIASSKTYASITDVSYGNGW